MRDTGIGIPHDKMDLLFKVFSQVDATALPACAVAPGSGLAICERLVHLMGGAISVSSEVGARVHVHLHHPRGLHRRARRKPLIEFIEDTVAASDRRLLVVDDNETNRSILALHTQRWGMEVVTPCASGEETLALMQAGEQAFDAAVIDMVMPEHGRPGPSASTLRDYPQAKKMPVIHAHLTAAASTDIDPHAAAGRLF